MLAQTNRFYPTNSLSMYTTLETTTHRLKVSRSASYNTRITSTSTSPDVLPSSLFPHISINTTFGKIQTPHLPIRKHLQAITPLATSPKISIPSPPSINPLGNISFSD